MICDCLPIVGVLLSEIQKSNNILQSNILKSKAGAAVEQSFGFRV